MGGEWTTLSLREAGVTLIDCDHRTPPASATGYPYVAIPQLRNGHIYLTDVRRITPENFVEWTRKAKPLSYDVVLSRRCNPGETAFVPPNLEFALGQNLVLLRADGTKVYPPFLRWLVRGPEWWEQIGKFLNVGAVFDSLKCADVPRFQLRIPPLNEQRAIAHILGTLDDKIELNRRMNETLEAMARALFKSWFIDFDPVRRNMARKVGQNQPSPAASRLLLPEGEGQYRGGYDFAGLVKVARDLRKRQTPAEEIFWELVRDGRLCGLKFRRQHQLGNYVTDFYCHERRLVIEFDGGIHRSKQAKDHKRDTWMEAQGFKVIRFPNEQLLDDPASVLTAIADPIEACFPSPPGRRAGVEGSAEAWLPPLPLGEGKGEGSVEELDQLFPDYFEDSELGEIPKGWVLAPLPDVIDVNPTRALRKGVEAPYLDMANMPTKGHSPDVVVDRAFGSGMRFVNGDTLVARITPCLENGKTAFVDFLEAAEVGWGSTEYIILRPKPPLPKEFAYCLARSDTFRDFAIQSMTGSSGRQRVPAESLSHYLLVVPPETIAKHFEIFVQPLFARAGAAARESRTLATFRDTLLPKLISGELRVPEGTIKMVNQI